MTSNPYNHCKRARSVEETWIVSFKNKNFSVTDEFGKTTTGTLTYRNLWIKIPDGAGQTIGVGKLHRGYGEGTWKYQDSIGSCGGTLKYVKQ